MGGGAQKRRGGEKEEIAILGNFFDITPCLIKLNSKVV